MLAQYPKFRALTDGLQPALFKPKRAQPIDPRKSCCALEDDVVAASIKSARSCQSRISILKFRQFLRVFLLNYAREAACQLLVFGIRPWGPEECTRVSSRQTTWTVWAWPPLQADGDLLIEGSEFPPKVMFIFGGSELNLWRQFGNPQLKRRLWL